MEQLCINATKTEKTVKNCAFTGHRVLQSDFSFETLEREIRKAIERGADTFYCGMAIGFDLLAAETVLQLKTEYGNVKLIACVPFYGQEKNFSVKDKEKYRSILKSADEKVILSDEYYRGCMQVRNKYMADRADLLITYCKKTTGGTAFTVKYFQKKLPTGEIVYI